MTIDQQIKINELLLKREELFAQIYEIENQVEAILGGQSYPFPKPPELPSSAKRQKAAKKPKVPKTPKIPKLKENEAAYSITYSSHGNEVTEIHNNTISVNKLLQIDIPEFQILTVKTIDTDGETVDELYTAYRE